MRRRRQKRKDANSNYSMLFVRLRRHTRRSIMEVMRVVVDVVALTESVVTTRIKKLTITNI
jgi:hypothetical protein